MYIIYGETDHQPRLDAWDKCPDFHLQILLSIWLQDNSTELSANAW